VPNTLPIISRWKILDNLRRSLTPPALVALLAAGWTILPGSAALWTTLALLVLAFPAYVQVARSLGSHVAGVPLREHFRAERNSIMTSLRQAVFSIVILAHQCVVMLDAMGRVAVRLLITRRRLLEWVTADRAERIDASVWSVARRMWPASALAVVIGALVATVAPGRLSFAVPILLLWILSPALVYTAGLPTASKRATLSRSERARFRQVARKTWRFFEDLVGPSDHGSCPTTTRKIAPIRSRTDLTDEYRLAAAGTLSA
jgi:cyclic beta-1,2-glucan synthetase